MERIRLVNKAVMKKAIEAGDVDAEAPDVLINGLLSARPPGKPPPISAGSEYGY